MRISNLFKVAP